MLSLNNSVMQLAFAAGAGIGGIALESSSILTLSWTGAVFAAIAIVVASVSFKIRSSSNNSLVAK
ncbi:hypothetical protein LL037_12120 [Clostridium estertheticum]|nr:hypothetical protein [Clostridium estertheticum]MBU3202513.1 hypothetical protein [Clostridium estertheticum]WAG67837.1 hypothetical protein LL037_12120 [Clostridium estertheticum]